MLAKAKRFLKDAAKSAIKPATVVAVGMTVAAWVYQQVSWRDAKLNQTLDDVAIIKEKNVNTASSLTEIKADLRDMRKESAARDDRLFNFLMERRLTGGNP